MRRDKFGNGKLSAAEEQVIHSENERMHAQQNAVTLVLLRFQERKIIDLKLRP